MGTRFVPRFRPHLHWQWGSGSGYSGSNLGGLRGDVLPDPGSSWAEFEAKATELCPETVRVINYIVGFKSGQNTPLATYGVLANCYPAILSWFYTDFPTAKTEGASYGMYVGCLHGEGEEDLSRIDTSGTAFQPSNEFAVNALAGMQNIGFSEVWLDAGAGNPIKNTDGHARIATALEEAGWRVGCEFWPYQWNVGASGDFIVEGIDAQRRPHMVTWTAFKTFFRNEFTTAPSGSELHICPMFGDSDFGPDIAADFIAKGCVVSPYYGFELTRPDTWQFLCEYYNGLVEAAETDALETCSEVNALEVDVDSPTAQECCDDEAATTDDLPQIEWEWPKISDKAYANEFSLSESRRGELVTPRNTTNTSGPPAPEDIVPKAEGPGVGGWVPEDVVPKADNPTDTGPWGNDTTDTTWTNDVSYGRVNAWD